MTPVRVALISDIHGNLVALDAVLDALSDDPPDRIVCLGDVALNGPQPREAVERLRGIGCPVVMGNVDAEALEGPRAAARDDRGWMGEVEAWGARQLTDDHRAFIRAFQDTVTVDLDEGATLLCYHGTPDSRDEGIEATTPPDALDAALKGQDTAVYAGGHTHVPMVRRHRDALVVNPGSVGLPYERLPDGSDRNPPWAEYAVVTHARGRLSVELRREPYPVQAVHDAIRESGVPHAEKCAGEWR